MKYFFHFAFLLGLGLSAHQAEAAPRLPIADHMTCNQAVNYYQQHKKIYVIAHGKNIVPIYGLKPVRERRNLKCRGRNKSIRSYWVDTLDTKTCVIAVHCV